MIVVRIRWIDEKEVPMVLLVGGNCEENEKKKKKVASRKI
jgi:hypothetical protein